MPLGVLEGDVVPVDVFDGVPVLVDDREMDMVELGVIVGDIVGVEVPVLDSDEVAVEVCVDVWLGVAVVVGELLAVLVEVIVPDLEGVEVTVLVKEIVAVDDGPAPAPTRRRHEVTFESLEVVTPM